MANPRKLNPKPAPEGYESPPTKIEGPPVVLHGDLPVAFSLLGEVQGWAPLPAVPGIGHEIELDGLGLLRGTFRVEGVHWRYAPLEEGGLARWHPALILEEV